MNLSLQWFPLLPVPLVLATSAAMFSLLTYGSWLLRKKSVPRRWIALMGVLRTGMIVVFTIGLLRPVVSMPRTVTLAPDAIVLVDTSESMAQPSSTGAGSRFDEVRGLLKESPALQSAGKSHQLHWFAFDRRARATSPSALQEIEANGSATELAASLDAAFQQVRLANASAGRDSVPTRVLVVSDGLDQGSKNAAEVAGELGVTVDVLAPSAGARGDSAAAAAIADVQGANRVLLGSETALQVTVKSNAAAEGLALVLEEEGRVLERRELPAMAAGQESHIVLSHKPGEAGLKRYSAKLVRGDEEIGRQRAVNVLVTDRRHDVLMLEDTWRWDFKFLKRVFEDDPSFSFTALASRGGGVYVQFGEPERRVQLGGFPRSRAELDGFETIILGNVDPTSWPRGLSLHLRNAVADGGKSLVVIAGPHISKWSDIAELAQLLPVEVTPESGNPASGRIEIRLTPEGLGTTWFTPGAGRPDGAAPNAAPLPVALPPMEHVYPVVRKRPAANVLVETTGSANALGQYIVMAEHVYGRGRVLFIGTDTLWQWQTLGPRDDAGTTLYSTFWQQALRAMAPPEPTSLPVQLWLRPERTVYRTGDHVRVSAELMTRQDSSKADAKKSGPSLAVASHVVLPDGRRLPLDLSPDRHNPSRHAAEFDASLPGKYRLEATARTESQTAAEVATVIEVLPRPGEKDPAPVDLSSLSRLASATGGRVIDPQATDGWLPTEASAATVVTQRRSIDLWHNFTLMLTLCVLLACDWSLRLFRGYV